MRIVRLSTCFTAVLLSAVGCNSSRSTETVRAAATVTCTHCHGDEARAATAANPLLPVAPPASASGDPAALTIGAHLVHLTGGPLSPAIACTTCHVIPTSVESHSRTNVVAFSGLAANAWAGAPAISPSYSRGSAALTCASTYCHGAFPNGVAANAPNWAGGPTQAACGTCHAVPPTMRSQGGTHPDVAATDCARCHTGYTSTTVDAAVHVNGQVEVTLTCTSCHGDATRTGTDAAGQAFAPAPPTDAVGSATGAAVGAHLRHLVNPRFSKPVACAECHQGFVPTAMNHANGTRDVAFGPLSRTVLLNVGGPPTPAWDGATASCSATYCHGAFRNGNGNGPVSWNGPQMDCRSCHGLPPTTVAQGGTHSANTRCSQCHPTTADGFPDPATHIDGKIDVLPLQ